LKCFDIKHHFIQDMVEKKIVNLHYFQKENNLANLFTKGIATCQFVKLRYYLVSPITFKGGHVRYLSFINSLEWNIFALHLYMETMSHFCNPTCFWKYPHIFGDLAYFVRVFGSNKYLICFDPFFLLTRCCKVCYFTRIMGECLITYL